MEDRRTDTDERAGRQQHRIGRGRGDEGEADERDPHSASEQIGFRTMVRVKADERLQQRSRDLEREGDQADLAEVQREGGFQDRIERRDERLHHVVEEMAEADGEKDRRRPSSPPASAPEGRGSSPARLRSVPTPRPPLWPQRFSGRIGKARRAGAATLCRPLANSPTKEKARIGA